MTPGTSATLRMMRKAGIEITRENYIAFNWAGLDVSEWLAEDEGELPENLQNWDLFELRGNKMVYVGPVIET